MTLICAGREEDEESLDTSALAALEDRDAKNNLSALEFRESVRRNQTPFRALYTSNYILDETLTLLKDRCGSEVATSFRGDLEASPTVRVLWVEEDIEAQAWRIFFRLGRIRDTVLRTVHSSR